MNAPLPAVADLLPHRGRWLLLDRITHLDPASATLEAIARFDADYADGHFPGRPVVPGVALLEAMAQALGCLTRVLEPDVRGTPLLAAFDHVRFRASVTPPAEVRVVVRLRERRLGLSSADARAYLGEETVCTARLTGAIAPHTHGSETNGS